MKRISGGQLSLGANATLLSSHAGGPRAATGDTSFAGQAKQSTQQSRVSPPPAREPTGQAGRHRPDPKDDDSDSSLVRTLADAPCRGKAAARPTRRLEHRLRRRAAVLRDRPSSWPTRGACSSDTMTSTTSVSLA